MHYQLILFDIGGVAVEVESDRLVHQTAQQLGRDFDDVQAAVYDKELLLPFELGQIDAKTYYTSLKKKLTLSWTFDQFVQFWNDIFRENTDVTFIMQRLRSHHRMMALTNTNALHLDHIRSSVAALSVLEEWVASCDVGLRKPDPKFYQHALDLAGVKASETVYVDDRPELVEAGRGVGLTAIRFENSQQLEQDLQSVGLNL